MLVYWTDGVLNDQLNYDVVRREGKFVANGIPTFLVKCNHMYVS